MKNHYGNCENAVSTALIGVLLYDYTAEEIRFVHAHLGECDKCRKKYFAASGKERREFERLIARAGLDELDPRTDAQRADDEQAQDEWETRQSVRPIY